jgi:hypothetical protein
MGLEWEVAGEAIDDLDDLGQLWGEMIELLVSKAKDINTSAHTGINVDSIIRSGIERFPAALSTDDHSNS